MHQGEVPNYLVFLPAGLAPRTRGALRPVNGGVSEGERVDGPVAADFDALQVVRRDGNVLRVAAVATPRPDLDETLHSLLLIHKGKTSIHDLERKQVRERRMVSTHRSTELCF